METAATKRPEIYLLQGFPPPAVRYCQTLFKTILHTDPAVKSWRENASFILVRDVTISADDINAASKLRVIGKQGAGIDIIDEDACAKRGIPILNTPGINAQSVAELVLCLTLAVARQLRTITVKQFAGVGVWKDDCSGITLTGKPIGIIGMGNIGTAVARLFRGAFNCPLYAYDPFVPADRWSDLDLPHTRVELLEDMLPHVDILTIHAPLNAQTRGMIAWPQLTSMRSNAILINAARGAIVNEDDLIRALQEGFIWGAGLDCHEEEPPNLERYKDLWDTGKVISTPHIGAATPEARVGTAKAAIDRVYQYITSGNGH
jgi:phosphoglycerate dehydrogenase-like enzyme